MIDANTCLALAQLWRTKAAGLREKYKGMGDLGNAASAGATALETCAGDVEELVAASRKTEACAVAQEGGA